MQVVTRETWGAAFGNGQPIPASPVALVVIHHTAGPDLALDATAEDERKVIRTIEGDHSRPKPPPGTAPIPGVHGKGWNGIAYSFLIFPSGRVYEGRGWRRVGAHTEGHNSKSVGIAFVVNAEIVSPTTRAMQACTELLQIGIAGKDIAEPFEIKGHRDFDATKCPGALLYPLLGSLRPTSTDTDAVAELDAIEVALDEIKERLARVRAAL